VKEYEIKKTIELTFIVEADSEEQAEEKAWAFDDTTAIGYDVYDIEILNPDEEDWEDEEE
jgi:hypothetical protein